MLYTPRINQCLQEFACAWNHHPLRTEHNWSPKKIWINGVVDPNRRDQLGVRDVLDPVPSDTATFGIDPCGPLPVNLDEESEGVLLEDVACPLSCLDLEGFNELFDPLCVCDDYGVSLFLAAREFVRSRSKLQAVKWLSIVALDSIHPQVEARLILNHFRSRQYNIIEASRRCYTWCLSIKVHGDQSLPVAWWRKVCRSSANA